MDPSPDDYQQVPDHVRPMLAQPGQLPSSSDGWAYEFKWDGVRAIVFVEGGSVRATSRNDKDLATLFPELLEIGDYLGQQSAILDGEIVAFDDDGRPNFGRLQQRLHLGSTSLIAQRARDVPASFLAFDLLYLDGRLLFELPYDARRELLERLELAGQHFATPPSVTDSDGSDVLDVSRERGLEGIVAKRRNSTYLPGQRSGAWVKIKNFRTQEVVIVGWTEGKGERNGSLGALLVGIPSGDLLAYTGKVGTGFSESTRLELLRLLKPLARRDSPFTVPLSPTETALAHFVSPDLVGEVRYGEWTTEGRLRHPTWRGLRPDKDPGEVIREP